jgi:hypothetical protein
MPSQDTPRASAKQETTCQRCELPLLGDVQAYDCRMCDPLCPIWGTHGHLWNGDEECSRAAYHTVVARKKAPSLADEIARGCTAQDETGGQS